MELEKRNIVLDLLSTQVPIPKIRETLGVSRDTFFRVQKSASLGASPGSGRRSRNFKNKIRFHIKNNSLKSIRKTTKKLKVHERTVRRTLNQLGADSYVCRKVQLISETFKQSRLACGKKILFRMKKQKSTVQIFSDESFWTVD